ncbi:hypothetical protein [Caulobacter segnis]|uniref:hypothetical protein n=1 Tax=Caulobacter segnis TaxID=88688 RepID=UPI001CC1BED9|nr:hypothetical protein [Caulobacter segnis]UAL08907.1 hypothetical protein K8940_13965 [Caulobacter segnis]
MNIRGLGLTGVSTLLRLAAAVGLISALTHALPFALFATVSTAMLYGQLIAILVDAGFNNELLRGSGGDTAAEHRDRLHAGTSVRIALLPGVVVVALIIGSVWKGLAGGQLLALTVGGMLLNTIIDTFFVSLRARRALKAEFLHSLFQIVLLGPIYLISVRSPWAAGAAIFATRVVSLVLLVGMGSMLSIVTSGFSFDVIREHYIRLRYYLLDTVTSNMGVRADSIAISLFCGQFALAAFQPAARVYYSALALASVVAGVVIPVAGRPGYSHPARLLTVAFSAAGGAISVAFLLFMGVFAEFAFGEQYKVTATVYTIIALTLLVRYVAAGAGAYLTLMGGQKFRAMAGSWIFLVTTIILVILGVTGFATVERVLMLMTLSQAATAAVYFYKSRRIGR